MTTPGSAIVIIQRNDCDFLKHAIAQARASNPASPIYLIVDGVTERFEGVSHIDMTGKFFGSWSFRLFYKHLNETGAAFERLCFQRWFVLRDLMRREGIERCVYIDTDVLLFDDVTAEQARYAASDLTLTKRGGALGDPHVCYVNNSGVLSRFCSFLVKSYALPWRRKELQDWYDRYHGEGHPGGVCDMVLFQRFDDAKLARIADLSGVHEGAAYDSSINASEGFEMEDGIKRIHWKDGLPYGTLTATGESVRFKALHFQGASKHRMGEYVRL